MTKRAPPEILDIDDPEVVASLKIVGKLVDVVTTPNVFYEDDERPGYGYRPVRPHGPGWYIHDSSHDSNRDKTTTWARDVFWIVENTP
jgi:hypothetical protein